MKSPRVQRSQTDLSRRFPAPILPAVSALAAELGVIDELVSRTYRADAEGNRPRLPGVAWFLDDGRVLCGDRTSGDSRIPYGRDGFTFWVSASGRMCGNDGLYHLFLPTGEGHDPPIAFFAGRCGHTSSAFRPLALLPIPFLPAGETDVYERFAVLGRDASYFVARTADLHSAVRVFVHQDEHGARIVFSLYLKNCDSAALRLYTSAWFNPFCRHQFGESSEDRWFKRIEVRPAPTDARDACDPEALPPFLVSVNEDLDRFQSMTNHALLHRAATAFAGSGGAYPRRQSTDVCTAQNAYLGSTRRGLASALFLETGAFSRTVPLTVFNDNAVAGDLIHWDLPPGSAIETHYVLSFPRDGRVLADQSAEPASAKAVVALLQAHRDGLAAEQGHLHLTFEESLHPALCAETCRHFLEFLKLQVEVCAQVRGHMQPSPNSLIGIRDVFQAIEGQLYDQPAAARRKILEALDYVLVDGRCPRQYSLPVNGHPGRADLREFVDQGLWVISTIHTYLRVTGDAELLAETAGYHRVSPHDVNAVTRAAERGTVLDHLLRIMDFLARQRDPETGLLRALYGDWNDALDGLGTARAPGEKFGTGVSVMASLQLFRNCAEMLELLERFASGDSGPRRAALARMRHELRHDLLRHAVVRRDGQRRIVHGWGDRRAYDVGSFADSDGQARDGLTSNAFWVLSGMLEADPTLRSEMLAAFSRLDSPYGLKTFAPGFEPDAPGVGRIPKLPIGTAENGATYVHASLFGVMALFALGEPHRAWDQIIKLLPFTPGHEGISHSPFVMPNSYVDNAELNLTGQNMNDWQTGSSNVLLKTLIRDVFGFEPDWDELRIGPASWSPFARMTLRCRAHGKPLRIDIRQRGGGSRVFRLNGANLAASFDTTRQTSFVQIDYALLSDSRENLVQVG